MTLFPITDADIPDAVDLLDRCHAVDGPYILMDPAF